MRLATVFKQVNPLPCAEGKLALVDGDAKVNPGQHRTDMGGHVIWPFERVAKLAGIFGNELFEVVAKIGDDVGVVVFLDRERS